MTTPFTKLQQLSSQQSDQLLSLFKLGFDGAQDAIDFQVRSLRRVLAASAQQAPLLSNPSSLAKGEIPFGELAHTLVLDWKEFLQNEQALARTIQEKARLLLEDNLRVLNQSLTESLAGFKAPTPANQEAIDIALRSWQAAAENAFAQAAEWQKRIEQASAQGSQVLAGLAVKTQDSSPKRRTGNVAA